MMVVLMVVISNVHGDLQNIRKNIISTFSGILLGDELAAEYLLYNIISRLYGLYFY